MTVEDETKEKDDSKADVNETAKKVDKASTGSTTVRRKYTYECLLAYRDSPIVKVKPECLSEEHFNEEGTWDPELWHASFSEKKSRSSSPAVGLELKLNRKLSDAKERIKQEQDGIILSPQRRSFNHGCQITFPQASSLTSERPRPKSPLDKDQRESRDAVNGRGNQMRRRVITRPSRETLLEKERERQREREAENGSYEEREQHDRYPRRGNYDRHQNRRRKEDSQPEWFLDAPTSQLETIELHGFGEEEEAERDEVNWERKKAREANQEKPDELAELVESLQRPKEDNPNSTPPNKDFDINDFFNFSDPVPIAPTTEEENQGLAQSRFSHLFVSSGLVVDGRSSSRGSSRRSSLQKDELDFLQELRNNSGSDTDTGSTPIQALINDIPESTPFTLLEMLQKTSGEGSIDVENDMRKREVKQKLIEGQAKSLAEIEAGLKKDLPPLRRRSSPGAVAAMARGGSPAGQGSEDQTAFNNFLASIGQTKSQEKAGSNEGPAPLSGSLSPDVTSNQGPGNLAGPFQNGPHDPLFSGFNDPEVRVPSQSPEVASVNELPFRTERLELRQNENRVPSPLNTGMLLDMLKVIAAQSGPPSAESVSYVPTQSPHEQVASLLQQSMMNNHRQQVSPEVVSNLLKQAAAANPALVASMISSGMLPAADVSSRGQQRSASPQECYQHALMQQQQQAAQRGRSPLMTSPLGFRGSPSPLAPSPHTGGITPPIGATSQHLIPPPPMGVAIPPGAHQPSPIRPRIPSPQELVKHTQSILQQALIKRQLEVQREKFYARERDTRNKSPVPSTPLQQGQRRMATGARTPPVTPGSKPSSTVLTTAFTPTSVIRKMHENKAEAKAAETKHSGPTEKQNTTTTTMTATAVSSSIPQTPGSTSQPTVSVETAPVQVDGLSQARGMNEGRPGPAGGHVSQPNLGLPGSSGGMEFGRGDAEGGRENVAPNLLQTNNAKLIDNANTPPVTKMVTANGDMAGMRSQLHHLPGTQPQQLSGSNPYMLAKPEFMNRDVEPGLEQHVIHNQPRPAAIPGQQQYPGGLPPDQLRPMMRLPGQPQQQQAQQIRTQHASHVMQPRAAPLNPQFPMLHPNQRMMMGAPMGISPMAQPNIMRGMMFPTNVPPPRPPTVNPMAVLAMQQLNQQRAALSQMQMPAQSATSPTQSGLTRGMLPPQFPTQQALHHTAAMGVPMVQQRNLSPAHPQLGQAPRTPLTQPGVPNAPMEHQRNMIMSLPTPSTCTNTPSATSPDSGSNPLAKWFGNDILKQSLNASRPAVPEGLKVLSVEELERQQQTVN